MPSLETLVVRGSSDAPFLPSNTIVSKDARKTDHNARRQIAAHPALESPSPASTTTARLPGFCVGHAAAKRGDECRWRQVGSSPHSQVLEMVEYCWFVTIRSDKLFILVMWQELGI